MDTAPPSRHRGLNDDAHEGPGKNVDLPESKRLNVGSEAGVEKAAEHLRPSPVTSLQAASQQEQMDCTDAASPPQMEQDEGSPVDPSSSKVSNFVPEAAGKPKMGARQQQQQQLRGATPGDNRGPNWHIWLEHKERCLEIPAEEKCRYGLVTLADIKPFPWHDAASGIDQELRSKVALWKGDITKLGVDAIVNAANRRLLGGGGVDGAIHKAAGKWLVEECRELHGCNTGEAKITGGYMLPAKHVIHTVGPTDGNPEDLKSCYEQCLRLVSEHKLRSVAFPCIATGIYGFPNRRAARIALEVTRNWLEIHHKQVEKVVFCVFLPEDSNIYTALLPEFFPLSPPSPAGVHVTQAKSKSTDRSTGRDDACTSARSGEPIAPQGDGARVHGVRELPGRVMSETLPLADDATDKTCEDKTCVAKVTVVNDESGKKEPGGTSDAGDAGNQKTEPGVASDAQQANGAPCEDKPGVGETAVVNDENGKKEPGGTSDAGDAGNQKTEPGVASDAQQANGAPCGDKPGVGETAVVNDENGKKESGGTSDAGDAENQKTEPGVASDAQQANGAPCEDKSGVGETAVVNDENGKKESGGDDDVRPLS